MRRAEPLDFFGVPGTGGDGPSRSVGVVLDATGIVVTNDHVISGASKIYVTTSDGRELEAELLGADADNDLAVLKVDGKGLKPVRLGTTADLMIGETAIAVGNPFGLSNTVTTGIVSALQRTVQGEGRTYTDFIQTDAAINPGNSGGALCNVLGELIGIDTAIVGGANAIGFAIPVERVRRIVDDLLRFGEVKAVWIGVRGTTVTADRARPSARGLGMRVRSVYPSSPAEGAGLEPGDVVFSLNGRPVESREDFDTLLSAVAPAAPVTLEVRRGERSRTVSMKAARAPEDLGLEILRREIGVSVAQVRGGLVITSVARDSPADRKGLERGDALLAGERQAGRDARGRRPRLRARLRPLGGRPRRRSRRLRLQPDVRPRLTGAGGRPSLPAAPQRLLEAERGERRPARLTSGAAAPRRRSRGGRGLPPTPRAPRAARRGSRRRRRP